MVEGGRVVTVKSASEKVGVKEAGPPAVMLAEGAEIVMVGVLLSTVKAPLGPAAGALFPAVSVAVPAATLMPSVPLPEMPERGTVRVVPLPVTPTDEAAAEPPAVTVM